MRPKSDRGISPARSPTMLFRSPHTKRANTERAIPAAGRRTLLPTSPLTKRVKRDRSISPARPPIMLRSPHNKCVKKDQSIFPVRQRTMLSQSPLQNKTNGSLPHVSDARPGTLLEQVEDSHSTTSPPDALEIAVCFASQDPPRDVSPSLNKYADFEFFQKYSNTTRETYGLNGMPEWPVLITFIPDIRGKMFLDLGCGSGAVCRWALENGVGFALGLDSSELMLSKACSNSPLHSRLRYLCVDLELPLMLKPIFDLVFSSLAVHYISNIQHLFCEVYDSLKPGGKFIFSINHPANLGGSLNPVVKQKSQQWPMDDYLRDGPRDLSWTGDSIRMQHRSIATYVNTLINTGFILERLHEWGHHEAPEGMNDPEGFWPVYAFFQVIKPAEEFNIIGSS